MRIVQIAPEIAPGSGVGAVAFQLEDSWRRAGVRVDRFTLADAGGSWLPEPGPGIPGKLALLMRVVWFSTVGTCRARAMIAALPGDAVTICHNDVLAADVYVNHGILQAAMRSRGNRVLRTVRNPVHLFTTARDAFRYRSGVHTVVVNLTRAEKEELYRTYGTVRSRTVVIGNGVDTKRFAPPTPAEQAAARAAAQIPERTGPTGDRTLHVVFIGHEFDRKGLPHLVRAVAALPHAHLSVVGGTSDMLADLRPHLDALHVADRVHLVGKVDDPRPWLRAADAVALPSAYEANALVVLEALACGVPVVATPVGYAPEIIVDAVNGFLVQRTAGSVRRALARLAAQTDEERQAMRSAARRSGLDHDWDRIAAEYLELFATINGEAP